MFEINILCKVIKIKFKLFSWFWKKNKFYLKLYSFTLNRFKNRKKTICFINTRWFNETVSKNIKLIDFKLNIQLSLLNWLSEFKFKLIYWEISTMKFRQAVILLLVIGIVINQVTFSAIFNCWTWFKLLGFLWWCVWERIYNE